METRLCFSLVARHDRRIYSGVIIPNMILLLFGMFLIICDPAVHQDV